MQVRDIMTQSVKTIRASATVEEAAELMALHDVGALPVCEDDRLIGILTDRDIVVRCLAPGFSPRAVAVRQIMSGNPAMVPPSASVEFAARLIANLRVRRLPVLADGRVVGMLSSDDIARRCDDDLAVLTMVRSLAPRRRRRSAVA